jgi:hypothetical protein
MPEDESLPRDEEELRRQIRSEIEQRDKQRQQVTKNRDSARSANLEAEKRRRIYQDELRKYYQDKAGYREIIRDDGEVDWVPEAEAQQAAELFDEVLEDPDEARSRMKWFIILGSIVVVVFIALMYFILHERTGIVQVRSNVPRAQIILDTTPLDRFTDEVIKEVPTGEHVITVALNGYKVQGSPVKFKLKGGETEIFNFTLIPDTTAKPTEQP